jgi:hypothetical protein
MIFGFPPRLFCRSISFVRGGRCSFRLLAVWTFVCFLRGLLRVSTGPVAQLPPKLLVSVSSAALFFHSAQFSGQESQHDFAFRHDIGGERFSLLPLFQFRLSTAIRWCSSYVLHSVISLFVCGRAAIRLCKDCCRRSRYSL